MTKMFCDMCGKEIQGDFRRISIGNSGAHVYKYSDGTFDRQTFQGEICMDCAREFLCNLSEDAQAKIRPKTGETIMAEVEV